MDSGRPRILTELPKPRAYILGKPGRLFHRGKVAAARLAKHGSVFQVNNLWAHLMTDKLGYAKFGAHVNVVSRIFTAAHTAI